MTKLQILIELDKSTEIQNFNKSNLKKSHTVNGWRVNPTVHAASQAMERRPGHTDNDWLELHKKMTDHINKNNVPAGDHAFYSKSTRQGYIASVNHAVKKINIVTVLPMGHSRAKEGTGKHIVENTDEVIFLD